MTPGSRFTNDTYSFVGASSWFVTYSMWIYEPLLPGLEVSELEKGTLETFEYPEIREDFLEVNVGE